MGNWGCNWKDQGILEIHSIQIVFSSASAMSSPTVNLYGQTYDQIVKNALAGSSKNFQLVYPFQNWTWPPPPKGFIDPQAYRFIGQVPQWSTIGRYEPGASDMHAAYLQVLSLPNALGDGVNEEQLRKANEHVTRTRNKLMKDNRTADVAYSNYRRTTSPEVPVQDYDSWLAEHWGPTLAADKTAYVAALKTLSLIANQKNPGLKDAVDAATLPGNGDEPKVGFAHVQTGTTVREVPNYIFPSPKEWVNQISSKGGGLGMSIQISASELPSLFSKSWSGGSVGFAVLNFFEVFGGGDWNKLDLETEDPSLKVTINIMAYNKFDVSPDPSWYNAGLLSVLAVKNDWNPPFSTTGGDGKKPVFGKDGVLPLMVTGLVVGYRPSIEITMSDAAYKKYKERFDACRGIRIGPFEFGGGSGHTEEKWSKNSDNMMFKVDSKAEYPFIMGITVASPGLPNELLSRL